METLKILTTIFMLILTTACGASGSKVMLNASGGPQFTDRENVILITVLMELKFQTLEYDVVSNKAKRFWPTFLPKEDSYSEVVYSPDFRKIAFTWGKPSKDIAEICIMNPDGTGFEKLTNSGKYNTDLFFSNDGNLIGFIRAIGNGGDEYFVYDLRTKQERRIGNHRFIFTNNPSFNADASKIAFTEYYEHNIVHKNNIFFGGTVNDYRIRLLDVKTGELTTVVDRIRNMVSSFIPNTNDILYLASDKSNGDDNTLSGRPERHGFFLHNLESKKSEYLGEAYATKYFLTISRDKKKVLYVDIENVGVFDMETRESIFYTFDKDEIARALKTGPQELKL